MAGYASLHHLGYGHMTVNHKAAEYVGADGASTNSIESVWAVLKRGIYGTYHHVSEKHLGRYAESLVTILLFSVDERISVAQGVTIRAERSTLIALDSKLISLTAALHIAEMHAEDRVITEDDEHFFLS
jgi:hypothetical protein